MGIHAQRMTAVMELALIHPIALERIRIADAPYVKTATATITGTTREVAIHAVMEIRSAHARIRNTKTIIALGRPARMRLRTQER